MGSCRVCVCVPQRVREGQSFLCAVVIPRWQRTGTGVRPGGGSGLQLYKGSLWKQQGGSLAVRGAPNGILILSLLLVIPKGLQRRAW